MFPRRPHVHVNSVYMYTRFFFSFLTHKCENEISMRSYIYTLGTTFKARNITSEHSDVQSAQTSNATDTWLTCQPTLFLSL